MNLNSPPSPFPIQHQIYNTQPYPPFGTTNPPSSPAVSCHIFFNSTPDHMGYYHQDQIYQPQHVSVSDDYPPGYDHGYNKIKNKVTDESGQLKLTLWKKQDQKNNNNHHPMKWMSSKMRLMQKMKSHPGRVTLKITGAAKRKTESGSDNLSCNSSSYTDNNNPIRVCSDCNTTKTPLWRSGPKGPKSLCNACGIRQRKARRAMAAAAASNGTAFSAGTYIQPSSTPSRKIKVQQHKRKNEHLKKRFKAGIDAANTEAASSSNVQKKIGFEDFLINLSKNLSFHRVFPEDEKDAAILLMALSSGLVHG